MTINPQQSDNAVNQVSQSHQMVQEIVEQLMSHAQGMWRYRWRALILMWVVSVSGWFAVYLMPPVYGASARIYVDTENAIRPLLQGIASSSNVLNEVTVVTRELLSRPNLAEVARETDLHLRAKTPQEFESLLVKLQKSVKVVGNRDNIFTITYADRNREKAVAVVDSLVNTFVERSLGADRSESSKAQSFLREQIDDYEARLTEAEDRLASFRRDNMAFMPNQTGDYFARMQTATTEMEETRQELLLAEERRAELLRQLEGEEPVFGIMTQPQQTASTGGHNSAKIRELELQLEELRLQYTDKHPRIGQLLDTIELLKQQEQQANAEAAAMAAENGPVPVAQNPLDLNPVYQNMRIQLTNTEVDVASLRSKYQQQQRRVTELKAFVDTVPQVEAELGRLNRDYGVVKTKYEQLLAQLETAHIGEDVVESIDDVQIRLIDPPFAASTPSGPKRQLMLSATLIVSFGVGLALAFLLNQLHPAFFSGRAITAATGLPILGSVSYLLSPAQARRNSADRLQFAAALGMLVISFSVAAYFANDISPILRSLVGARA